MNGYRAACQDAGERRRLAYLAWQAEPTAERRAAFHAAHRAYDDAVHALVWELGHLPGGLIGERIDPTPRPWWTVGRR